MEENLTQPTERPFCVGVFATVEQADRAIHDLQQAGFDRPHITVICSDKIKEQKFGQFEHEKSAGSQAPIAAATGSAIGAFVGGLASVAAIVGTGGIGLIAAGPLFAGTGAIVGGLVGAMTTRGVEREIADYYDQAVVGGKILVAAEDHGPRPNAKLAEAERILSAAGSEPIRLREG